MLAVYLALIEAPDDKQKFRQLYERYFAQMHYIAYSILRSPELADEAVHEAFLKIIKNFSKISDLECQDLAGWIVIIIRNTSLTILQKEKRSLPIADESLFRRIDKQNAALLDEHEELLAEINALSPQNRAILELHYFGGYKAREIAEMLGLSTYSVQQRLSRTIRRLRERLTEQESEDKQR